MPSNPLPVELDFLRTFEISETPFRDVSWRQSSFEEPVWHCNFGGTGSTIDFRVTLDDGSLLTDSRHARLLESVRTYLCVQTNPYWAGSHILSHKTESMLVSTAIHVVDYFLLRSKKFNISTKGFSGVLKEDIARFLAAVGSQKRVKASLYDVEEELINFLRQCTVVPLTDTGNEPPGLMELDVERILPMSEEELRNARRFLWHHGFYEYTSSARQSAKFRVRSQALLRQIYGGRVIGNLKFDCLPLTDLEFGSRSSYVRELPHVPIHSQSEVNFTSQEVVAKYTRALRSMSFLAERGYELIDAEALSQLDNRVLIENLKTKLRGRFVTLDFKVASKALGDAIAFVLDYGEDLVASYLKCAAVAKKSEKKLSEIDLKKHLRRRIRALGVVRWRLPIRNGSIQYMRLRNREALYELLMVLYGSIIIIVNTLMARRVEELLGLKHGSWWLESAGWYLRFSLGKANVGNHRKVIDRPLPSIGAKLFDLLRRLQDGLSELGVDVRAKSIFALPHVSRVRLTKASHGTINTCLDYFCDYMETATDTKGRRYYIRTHQLRRNFAMLFFWQAGFGGIEVLRWFLGHVKASHIYRYISESLPGEVLRRVQAEYVAHGITQGTESGNTLPDLLRKEYGISDVSFMPEADLADYIESLIDDGRIQVEPVFFDLPSGVESYKVLVKITEMPGE